MRALRSVSVRTWVAAALLAFLWAWQVNLGELLYYDLTAPSTAAGAVFAVAMLVGLVTRRSWPRPILLGYAAWALPGTVLAWLTTKPALHAGVHHLFAARIADAHRIAAIACVVLVIATGLLAPWRRRDLDRHAWALALLGLAFAGARELAIPGIMMLDLSDFAMLCAGLALIGCVRRGPWGPALGVLTAIVQAAHTTGGLPDSMFGHGLALNLITVGGTALHYSPGLAALVGARLAWQRAATSAGEVDSSAGAIAPEMRLRWTVLFASAMTSLASMAWITGFDQLRYWGGPLIGACLCAAIGVWCTMGNVRQRWPAVVALVASVPLLGELRDLIAYRLAHHTVPAALLVGAAIATTVAAVVVAIRRPPLPPPLPAAHMH